MEKNFSFGKNNNRNFGRPQPRFGADEENSRPQPPTFGEGNDGDTERPEPPTFGEGNDDDSERPEPPTFGEGNDDDTERPEPPTRFEKNLWGNNDDFGNDELLADNNFGAPSDVDEILSPENRFEISGNFGENNFGGFGGFNQPTFGGGRNFSQNQPQQPQK